MASRFSNQGQQLQQPKTEGFSNQNGRVQQPRFSNQNGRVQQPKTEGFSNQGSATKARKPRVQQPKRKDCFGQASWPRPCRSPMQARPGGPARPARPVRPGQPPMPGAPAWPARPAQPGRQSQLGQPGKPDQAGQLDQPTQVSQASSRQLCQLGHLGQLGQLGQPGSSAPKALGKVKQCCSEVGADPGRSVGGRPLEPALSLRDATPGTLFWTPWTYPTHLFSPTPTCHTLQTQRKLHLNWADLVHCWSLCCFVWRPSASIGYTDYVRG